ncbi:MurR/RpiR family transcriptional regulator [Virgibacillus ihumii]|uniref:MurR/RpiR family transcriptional regulator n=1 Tax=Virgibacillus ihumii TaxID=2686091 RepID=UPI00157C2894|nr:MurR/RpiR family transcriptional regulator [Virgibacillus ihumii]
MEKLYAKIKQHQASFSKSLKKIAAYVYNDPSVFAMNSAKEAGKRIGVSETTIIRFAHTLGYKGYSALQQEYQNSIFRKKSSLDNYRNQKFSPHESKSIKNHMFQDLHTIQTAMEQISDNDLEKVVQKLRNSSNTVVTGAQASFPLAYWLTFTLDIVSGNVQQFVPGVDSLKRISELDENSVFVAFSFHRYSSETTKLAKAARKQGTTVISFTDNAFSPIAEHSDITLAVHTDERSTLDIVPAIFSLVNSIMSAVSRRNPKSFQQSIEAFNSTIVNEFFE